LLKSIGGWSWKKSFIPPEVQRKRDHLVNITAVKPYNPGEDVTKYRSRPVCLITGDGSNLPDEVREFSSWNVPHDVYCVNRSMLFFERQVTHWCAIDVEESVWFANFVTDAIEPDKKIIRHTIGEGSFAFDVYWQMDIAFENDFQRRVLTGNSGYFAILTAIQMGYEQIVLAGIPLDMSPCWYESAEDEGPNWNGWTYTQWMDFKIKIAEADRVRSLGGYTEFILGKATKDWLKA
jgi:hypothetical protein